MMWEPNVVAAQVEPYVTDYGIDTVSNAEDEARSAFHFPYRFAFFAFRNRASLN